MDVSGWSIEQKMRLPDWCFGQRELHEVYQSASSGMPANWAIGNCAWPDPACIWQVACISTIEEASNGYYRFGLADTVPTSEAEMNAAVDIFPCYGPGVSRPPKISMWVQPFCDWMFDCRRGIVTGGKKLVIEVYATAGTVRAHVVMNVSALPTHMAGWLAHNKV